MKITKETARKILARLDKTDKKMRKSAWNKGVSNYVRWGLAAVLDGETDENRDYEDMKEYFLNGAENFKGLSYGGSYYIYDEDIAKELAPKSAIRYSKKDGRLLPPNSRESWLDVQARALKQACTRALTIYCYLLRYHEVIE